MKITRNEALIAFVSVGIALLGWTLLWPSFVNAADGEGAYTLVNAVAEGYHRDKQTAVYREDCNGTDALTDLSDIANVTTEAAFVLYDESSASEGVRQNLSVSVRFSDSGADATVWAAFFYYDGTSYHLLGVDQPIRGGLAITLDATAGQDGEGLYMSHTFVFDTYGATHVILPVTAISAGTCDLWVGSF